MKALIAVAAALGMALVEAAAAEAHFSRAELILGTRPMGEAYMKILEAESPGSAAGRRLDRIFADMLEHAKRLHPHAPHWDWQLVLVAKDLVAPFALPDGRIFVSPKWVAVRRLTEAEIALLLAHEMAHVLAEHMLERVSALAAARPARNMRVADVLRMIEAEWYLARELEPLMQAQELAADRIGLAIVCAAGVPHSRALTLFDKMARAETGPSYVASHDDPIERKLALAKWSRGRGLGCRG
jgi:predicted Zn-dependent protease